MPFPISDHCDGRRFFNPGANINRSWLDLWRWKRSSRPSPWPKSVPTTPAQPPPLGDSALAATWIGHSSFLLQTPAGAILTDPVFRDRVGPFGFIGPRRVRAPGVAFEDLPPIRFLLLSHDHYDHCDQPTLRRLALKHSPVVFTPLGNGPLLRAAGFEPNAIVELDWWQRHRVAPGCEITLLPARHWSNRLSGSRNGRLWGGFGIKTPAATTWFAGDTGYDETLFRDIRTRFGAPDLALIPIGAYEPRWFMTGQHCDPAEAVRIHLDVGARRSVGMHWGTFPLTDEAIDAPPRELAQALKDAGLPESAFLTPAPGETVRI